MGTYLGKSMEFGQQEWQWGQKTYVMGILNATPDSFSDGGKFNQIEAGVARGLLMLEEGADAIDIGGESTRPGAIEVELKEERLRVVPLIKALRAKTKAPLSVDTYKAGVAQAALEAGADIINDVWGLQRDPEIADVAASHKAPVIIMHNQIGTEYTEDIVLSMTRFFEKSLSIAIKAGIAHSQIVLDPGIGFGKTAEQNVEVMKRLSEFCALGYPLLLGTSRKSFIGKILDLPSDQRLEGTISTNVLGVVSGIDIVRVHDVKENKRALLVADALVRGNRG